MKGVTKPKRVKPLKYKLAIQNTVKPLPFLTDLKEEDLTNALFRAEIAQEHLGFNNVIRQCEQEKLACCVIDSSLNPLLLKFLAILTRKKNVAAIQSLSLGSILHKKLGFKCSTLGIKKTLLDFSDNNPWNTICSIVSSEEHYTFDNSNVELFSLGNSKKEGRLFQHLVVTRRKRNPKFRRR